MARVGNYQPGFGKIILQDQNARYESLNHVVHEVNPIKDIISLAETLTLPSVHIKRFPFQRPDQMLELYSDDPSCPVSQKVSPEGLIEKLGPLRKEKQEVEGRLQALINSIETLQRLQQRSLDSSFFNKANDIQEEISMKRFDLRMGFLYPSKKRQESPSPQSSMSPQSPMPPTEPNVPTNFNNHNFIPSVVRRGQICDLCQQPIRGPPTDEDEDPMLQAGTNFLQRFNSMMTRNPSSASWHGHEDHQ
ncbi:unnamed protein product [Cyprideis torosa]|uniref:Uncharacterized protein n=1 Tax=Cyprideis torosa TaxID=163714 RepID=A0A7R8WBA1_9CRUS|nr:unnamed protein product [Cyprideis torosa]CAG0892083.1 unnamed protein product [Cyprideis torosa]